MAVTIENKNNPPPIKQVEKPRFEPRAVDQWIPRRYSRKSHPIDQKK